MCKGSAEYNVAVLSKGNARDNRCIWTDGEYDEIVRQYFLAGWSRCSSLPIVKCSFAGAAEGEDDKAIDVAGKLLPGVSGSLRGGTMNLFRNLATGRWWVAHGDGWSGGKLKKDLKAASHWLKF